MCNMGLLVVVGTSFSLPLSLIAFVGYCYTVERKTINSCPVMCLKGKDAEVQGRHGRGLER